MYNIYKPSHLISQMTYFGVFTQRNISTHSLFHYFQHL